MSQNTAGYQPLLHSAHPTKQLKIDFTSATRTMQSTLWEFITPSSLALSPACRGSEKVNADQGGKKMPIPHDQKEAAKELGSKVLDLLLEVGKALGDMRSEKAVELQDRTTRLRLNFFGSVYTKISKL